MIKDLLIIGILLSVITFMVSAIIHNIAVYFSIQLFCIFLNYLVNLIQDEIRTIK